MLQFLHAAILVTIISGICRAADAPPATQPAANAFTLSQAKKAEEVMTARLAQLDADFRAKKADVLQKYATSLTEAKVTAMRSGDRKEAQKIYESIQAILNEIEHLSPGVNADRAAKPLTPFHVKIREFEGGPGFAETVEVGSDSVSVVAEDDFGHPPRVIWRGDLRPSQKKRMSAFMSGFPLDQLADGYVDMNVLDGYEITFTIQVGTGKERKIEVGNRQQRDLEHLIAEVNDLLPPKYALDGMGGASSFRAGK